MEQMKYKITGIKNSIEIDTDTQQFLIDQKKYEVSHILHISYYQASINNRGYLFILLDDFQTYKIEFIFSQYLDINETARQIYEKLKPQQEKIKACLFAKYDGGANCILQKGDVLIVLFENELVIRKDHEEYRTSYDDIASLSFAVDKNTVLEDNSHSVFNYFFFGLAAGTILNQVQREMTTKYQGVLTISSKTAGDIMLYSPAMNELYHLLCQLTNIEKDENQSYKVEYLKMSDSKEDAIELENLLNRYAKENWHYHEIIDRKDYVLVIFSK